MLAEADALGAITVMAAVTFLTRVIGPAIMARVPLSPAVERALDGMASAVLAAIVATFLWQHGPREAAAVVVAGLVMLATRSAVGAMVAAMALAALWRSVAG